MVFVVFVVLACRILGKPALQAVLRVFGLCGSCVVLVWADLWFLVTCGFWVLSARPFALCGSVVLPSIPMLASGLARPLARMDCASTCPRCSMPMIARPLARRDCASTGFPYCQKPALELQALAREPPLVVPTKTPECARRRS